MTIRFHYSMGTAKLTGVALLLVGFFGTPCLAGPRDDDVAAVEVYKQVAGAEVSYAYSVTNRGVLPLLSFTVGFDYYRGNTELSGSKPKAVLSPSQWEGQIVKLEESDRYEVRWDVSSPAASIKPGQTLTGFRIVRLGDDVRLGTSNWTVTVDGPPTHASSALQLVQGPPPDTVPPSITVSVSPAQLWPPDRRLVEITANVVASDNLDSQPQIRLVSIACNECDQATDILNARPGTNVRNFQLRADRAGRRKEGRIYTVTYSATDAAGNVATAEGRVVVPHDMRR